ncbi:hypothetical protein A2U01_0052983, partial [Trifolium medium]|nr:hypothetical protein [Trifolium medium]
FDVVEVVLVHVGIYYKQGSCCWWCLWVALARVEVM